MRRACASVFRFLGRAVPLNWPYWSCQFGSGLSQKRTRNRKNLQSGNIFQLLYRVQTVAVLITH